VGDRLRAAAFAEIQARDAFLWAAETFEDASPELRAAWKNLATSEQRHLDWLLRRMNELGIPIQERRVSDQLWISLTSCKSARDFALYMASAEERGRRAGERFHAELQTRDPETAQIFGKIAEEEIAHIELARRFFSDASPTSPA
jgi:rubrerythrin